MLNKVVICGIDTSELEVIPAAEMKELMLKIKAGDDVARERFIRGNLKLVLSVLRRFSGRGEDPDDLFQVGCIGLIKAIDNFDVSQDVRFSTYAVPMIIGELRRYLRDNNPIRVSRSVRDTAYKALTAKEKLTNKLGREPTPEEIAKELGLTRKEVVLALEAIVDPKKFELKTPDVSIKVSPEKKDLVETRVIDGVRFILVRADGGVELNGVNIEIK